MEVVIVKEKMDFDKIRKAVIGTLDTGRNHHGTCLLAKARGAGTKLLFLSILILFCFSYCLAATEKVEITRKIKNVKKKGKKKQYFKKN